jgi:hypothetical protein
MYALGAADQSLGFAERRLIDQSKLTSADEIISPQARCQRAKLLGNRDDLRERGKITRLRPLVLSGHLI